MASPKRLVRLRRFLGRDLPIAVLFLGMTAGAAIYVYSRSQSGQRPQAAEGNTATVAPPSATSDGTPPVRLSPEARKNLELVTRPFEVVDYWRTVEFPAVVTDRPGVSDRGVVAPVTGIVTQIHAYPGNTVTTGAPLVSLRLVSDSLYTSQLELFKATKEIEIARQQRQRLAGLVESGGVAGSRIIELDNQIERMEVQVQAYRQDLVARGLGLEQIDAAARGAFLTEITVVAPTAQPANEEGNLSPPPASGERDEFRFELHSLRVELGQQVEAGEVLCLLADHRLLQIEGRGFKHDLPLIQRAARERLPIEIVAEGEDDDDWPELPRPLEIANVANVIDPESRSFAFYLPLENRWRTFRQADQTRFVWRFRPGDRVRLRVAVEKLENVIVLPRAAAVWEGPEAYIFRQNGDLFDRLSVHVLHEDSALVVLANDGRIRQGAFLAQNSAAALNRVLKAQLASGIPSNVHVHADGTVHAAH